MREPLSAHQENWKQQRRASEQPASPVSIGSLLCLDLVSCHSPNVHRSWVTPNVGHPSENHLILPRKGTSQKVAKTPKDEPGKQLREKTVRDRLVRPGSCLTYYYSSTVWENYSPKTNLRRAGMQSLDVEDRKTVGEVPREGQCPGLYILTHDSPPPIHQSLLTLYCTAGEAPLNAPPPCV